MWQPLPVRPDAPLSPDERRAALDRLLAWANANGARWNGIEFQVDATGSARGVAIRPLAAGEPILTLPRRLMIVDNELASSTTGTLDPRDALATWLPLAAKASESPWRAYLETLPTQLAELPIFRSADDLAALVGTAANALAIDTRRDILDAYERLPSELRARLSLADFAWGRAIVMSRGFHAPGTFEHRVALFPLVELFNDGRDDTTWSYTWPDGLVIRTECAFETGEEVHFSYGHRSNSHLLVHFGFALPNNTANEARLMFEAATVHVGALFDDRLVRALSLARLGSATEESALDVLATAAHRARAELDAGPPSRSHHAWDQACALVRDGERAILDQIIELATVALPYTRCTDPAQLRAAAADIPADALGVRGMLRQYLEDLATELPR